MGYRNLAFIHLVEEHSSSFNAPKTYHPTYGSSEDGARPHKEHKKILKVNSYSD